MNSAYPISMINKAFVGLSLLCLPLLLACQQQPPKPVAKTDSQTKQATVEAKQTARAAADVNPKVQKADPKWQSLMTDDKLDDWEAIVFGGEGDFEIQESAEGNIFSLTPGDPFTGFVSSHEDLPTSNYEVTLHARKTDGIDFFCGLTFPVADSHATLIVGGWAGSTVGISCIDDLDASRNDTQVLRDFKKDQWYQIRVRVLAERIECWIDDERLIDADILGKKIAVRGDTNLCRPFGVCSFQTDAEIKGFKIRTLDEVEIKQGMQEVKANRQKINADQEAAQESPQRADSKIKTETRPKDSAVLAPAESAK